MRIFVRLRKGCGASLSGANLSSANLSSADLRGAHLSSADLRGADLRGASLSSANLSSADLRGADLRGADLSSAKNDFWEILLRAPKEIAGLRAALVEGRIDGSTYEGACSCLVGTLAQVRGVRYQEMGFSPDSSRPAERWFMAIKKGDTPENNVVSKITVEWLDEFVGLLGAIKENHAVGCPLERSVRLFKSLPLGTRFKYQGGNQVWVILERHGCGTVAKWEGADGRVAGQSICSFADTPEECETTEVILCEGQAERRNEHG